jgi:hypothetical protein
MIFYYKQNPDFTEVRLFIAENEDILPGFDKPEIVAEIERDFLYKPASSFFSTKAAAGWCNKMREIAKRIEDQYFYGGQRERIAELFQEGGTTATLDWGNALYLALRYGTEWKYIPEKLLMQWVPSLFEEPKLEPIAFVQTGGEPAPASVRFGGDPRGHWSWDTARTLSMLKQEGLDSSLPSFGRIRVSPKAHRTYTYASVSRVLNEYVKAIVANFILARERGYKPDMEEFEYAVDTIMTSSKARRTEEAWDKFKDNKCFDPYTRAFKTLLIGDETHNPWPLTYYMEKKFPGGLPGGAFPKDVEDLVKKMDNEPWLADATYGKLRSVGLTNSTARKFMQARKFLKQGTTIWSNE